MNYLIIDTTANSEAIYIGEGMENCNLIENAMKFDSEEEAQQYIDDNNIGEWASTMELEVQKMYYIVNQFTAESYSTMDERFYPNNWEPELNEDKQHLQDLIDSNPEKFVGCVIVELQMY